MEKLWKGVIFAIQMLVVLYVISVLLGAPFISNFEQTFMFSCILTVLAVVPVILYLEIDDIFQLLDVVTQPPKDSLHNMIILQFEITLLGAWLGAVPIPLDWNREWQIWPTTCVLGTFCGYFIANIVSYGIQSTNIFSRYRKSHRFKNVL
ncbi:hypothetical protein HHI36_021662 [Cryptolaemus montrouzieri]|uniref:Phosphatidylinositol-glycan biosynthesis class F protein n=1 Tax=Cryptolaemus montrouzieri TaxID=559131 RepID=A0ABD2MXU5_9CUCU